MLYAIPQFSRQLVNTAGRALIDPDKDSGGVGESLHIINNWRAAHAFPLNTLHMTLRNRTRSIDPQALTAQRTKRLASITSKLARQPSMNLTQMQDIGGCRAVVKSIDHLRQLVNVYSDSRYSHTRHRSKDYIAEPKIDGYRSVHLIYRYKSTSLEKIPYEGLQIELQLRTNLQHVWATAVEAAGTFTSQALKSNQGSDDWLRFFALVGSYFARLERCPPVPNTPPLASNLREEIRYLADHLHVIQVLQGYSATLREVERFTHEKYFLVKLDPSTKEVQIHAFKAADSELANDRYTALETETAGDPDSQVVLVSVESVAALKRAYPNYFLDTTAFVQHVRRLLGSANPNPQQFTLF